MDAKSWEAVSPQHPQFAIKQLIEAIGVGREKIITLGTESEVRAWLASERCALLKFPMTGNRRWPARAAELNGRLKMYRLSRRGIKMTKP